jgi:hypothetical protein
MDNAALDGLLASRSERRYWLKPVGLPGQPMAVW